MFHTTSKRESNERMMQTPQRMQEVHACRKFAAFFFLCIKCISTYAINTLAQKVCNILLTFLLLTIHYTNLAVEETSLRKKR